MTADLIDWSIRIEAFPLRGISLPSNFTTSDFLLTWWPFGRCILWQLSTGAHYWSLKFLLFRLSVPCCSAVLPWRQNLSSCGDFKWPVKLQFQGSVRSATLTPGSREKNVSSRMDAEIFWPPRNVVTLNTIPAQLSGRKKGGSLTEAKKCQTDGVTGWCGSNQSVSASKQTNTDLWWRSGLLFMPLPFRLGKIRLLSCLCKMYSCSELISLAQDAMNNKLAK